MEAEVGGHKEAPEMMTGIQVASVEIYHKEWKQYPIFLLRDVCRELHELMLRLYAYWDCMSLQIFVERI